MKTTLLRTAAVPLLAAFVLFAALAMLAARPADPAPTDAVVSAEAVTSADAVADITWMSWDRAMAAHAKAPKRLLVDIYTDWSGWNKRMDATSWKDPRVQEYVAANFYAVKLDAESTAPIEFQGKTYTFEKAGNRGVHGLASMLLDDRLSYPVVVYLDANLKRTMISPGFKDADKLLAELRLANGE